MIVYMKHPLHGAMHVYSEQEAVWHESIGWVRHPWPPEPEPEEEQAVVKRGPGRPRKSVEELSDGDV